GVDERLLAMLIRERGVTAPHIGKRVVRLPSQPARPVPWPLRGLADRRVEYEREHVLGTREGHSPQQEADLFAESARCDEHQPFHPLRELICELHRDTTAERVTNHSRALLTEHSEQVAPAAGVGAERAAPPRLRRPPG